MAAQHQPPPNKAGDGPSSSVAVYVRVRDVCQAIDGAPASGHGATPLAVSVDGQRTLHVLQPRAAVVEADSAGQQQAASASRTFTFDGVLSSVDEVAAARMPEVVRGRCGIPPVATQFDVFAATGERAVTHAVEGFNACIFAYGQTGSGKTHTMMGPPSSNAAAAADSQQQQHEAGVIPRVCAMLFDQMAAMDAFSQSGSANAPQEYSYHITGAFFEVYNEQVNCLLGGAERLQVRQTCEGDIVIPGLRIDQLTSCDAALDLLRRGSARRHSGKTAMNDRSSRSHAIFQLRIRQSMLTPDGDLVERSSRVNLVDLAGSERCGKTQTVVGGDRFKEGVAINSSLTALGQVIHKLAARDGDDTGSFVNYRDSALTWVLRDDLGGNAKTCMVATVSPAAAHTDETLSTLRYADRVKRIKNRAVVNEDHRERMIRELKAELARLRKDNTDLSAGLGGVVSRGVSLSGHSLNNTMNGTSLGSTSNAVTAAANVRPFLLLADAPAPTFHTAAAAKPVVPLSALAASTVDTLRLHAPLMLDPSRCETLHLVGVDAAGDADTDNSDLSDNDTTTALVVAVPLVHRGVLATLHRVAAVGGAELTPSWWASCRRRDNDNDDDAAADAVDVAFTIDGEACPTDGSRMRIQSGAVLRLAAAAGPTSSSSSSSSSSCDVLLFDSQAPRGVAFGSTTADAVASAAALRPSDGAASRSASTGSTAPLSEGDQRALARRLREARGENGFLKTRVAELKQQLRNAGIAVASAATSAAASVMNSLPASTVASRAASVMPGSNAAGSGGGPRAISPSPTRPSGGRRSAGTSATAASTLDLLEANPGAAQADVDALLSVAADLTSQLHVPATRPNSRLVSYRSGTTTVQGTAAARMHRRHASSLDTHATVTHTLGESIDGSVRREGVAGLSGQSGDTFLMGRSTTDYQHLHPDAAHGHYAGRATLSTIHDDDDGTATLQDAAHTLGPRDTTVTHSSTGSGGPALSVAGGSANVSHAPSRQLSPLAAGFHHHHRHHLSRGASMQDPHHQPAATANTNTNAVSMSTAAGSPTSQDPLMRFDDLTRVIDGLERDKGGLLVAVENRESDIAALQRRLDGAEQRNRVLLEEDRLAVGYQARLAREIREGLDARRAMALDDLIASRRGRTAAAANEEGSGTAAATTMMAVQEEEDAADDEVEVLGDVAGALMQELLVAHDATDVAEDRLAAALAERDAVEERFNAAKAFAHSVGRRWRKRMATLTRKLAAATANVAQARAAAGTHAAAGVDTATASSPSSSQENQTASPPRTAAADRAALIDRHEKELRALRMRLSDAQEETRKVRANLSHTNQALNEADGAVRTRGEELALVSAALDRLRATLAEARASTSGLRGSVGSRPSTVGGPHSARTSTTTNSVNIAVVAAVAAARASSEPRAASASRPTDADATAAAAVFASNADDTDADDEQATAAEAAAEVAAETNAAIESLLADVDKATSAAKQQRDAYEAAVAAKKGLEAELAAVVDARDAAVAEARVAEAEVRSVTLQLEQVRRESDAAAAADAAAHMRACTELQVATQSKDAAEISLRETRQTVEQLQCQVAAHAATLASKQEEQRAALDRAAHTAKDDAERLWASKVAESNLIIASLEEEGKDLHRAVELRMRQIADLKRELEAAHGSVAVVATVEADLAASRATIENLNDEIAALRLELAALRNHQRGATTVEEPNAVLPPTSNLATPFGSCNASLAGSRAGTPDSASNAAGPASNATSRRALLRTAGRSSTPLAHAMMPVEYARVAIDRSTAAAAAAAAAAPAETSMSMDFSAVSATDLDDASMSTVGPLQNQRQHHRNVVVLVDTATSPLRLVQTSSLPPETAASTTGPRRFSSADVAAHDESREAVKVAGDAAALPRLSHGSNTSANAFDDDCVDGNANTSLPASSVATDLALEAATAVEAAGADFAAMLALQQRAFADAVSSAVAASAAASVAASPATDTATDNNKPTATAARGRALTRPGAPSAVPGATSYRRTASATSTGSASSVAARNSAAAAAALRRSRTSSPNPALPPMPLSRTSSATTSSRRVSDPRPMRRMGPSSSSPGPRAQTPPSRKPSLPAEARGVLSARGPRSVTPKARIGATAATPAATPTRTTTPSRQLMSQRGAAIGGGGGPRTPMHGTPVGQQHRNGGSGMNTPASRRRSAMTSPAQQAIAQREREKEQQRADDAKRRLASERALQDRMDVLQKENQLQRAVAEATRLLDNERRRAAKMEAELKGTHMELNAMRALGMARVAEEPDRPSTTTMNTAPVLGTEAATATAESTLRPAASAAATLDEEQVFSALADKLDRRAAQQQERRPSVANGLLSSRAAGGRESVLGAEYSEQQSLSDAAMTAEELTVIRLGLQRLVTRLKPLVITLNKATAQALLKSANTAQLNLAISFNQAFAHIRSAALECTAAAHHHGGRPQHMPHGCGWGELAPDRIANLTSSRRHELLKAFRDLVVWFDAFCGGASASALAAGSDKRAAADAWAQQAELVRNAGDVMALARAAAVVEFGAPISVTTGRGALAAAGAAARSARRPATGGAANTGFDNAKQQLAGTASRRGAAASAAGISSPLGGGSSAARRAFPGVGVSPSKPRAAEITTKPMVPTLAVTAPEGDEPLPRKPSAAAAAASSPGTLLRKSSTAVQQARQKSVNNNASKTHRSVSRGRVTEASPAPQRPSDFAPRVAYVPTDATTLEACAQLVVGDRAVSRGRDASPQVAAATTQRLVRSATYDHHITSAAGKTRGESGNAVTPSTSRQASVQRDRPAAAPAVVVEDTVAVAAAPSASSPLAMSSPTKQNGSLGGRPPAAAAHLSASFCGSPPQQRNSTPGGASVATAPGDENGHVAGSPKAAAASPPRQKFSGMLSNNASFGRSFTHTSSSASSSARVSGVANKGHGQAAASKRTSHCVSLSPQPRHGAATSTAAAAEADTKGGPASPHLVSRMRPVAIPKLADLPR